MTLDPDHQRPGRAAVPQLAAHHLEGVDARCPTPMLFTLGVVFVFALGGLTGLYLATISTDLYLHDTMFVVGHFHLTMAAATFLAIFAAIYFWFPKMFGRLLDERLGKAHFWLSLVFITLLFCGQLLVGLRRPAAPAVGPAPVRLPQAPGAAQPLDQLLRLRPGGQPAAVRLVNFFANVFRKPNAEANPWKVGTLEWTVPSPPPPHNFDPIPTVVRGPHELSNPEVRARAWAATGSPRPRRCPSRRRSRAAPAPEARRDATREPPCRHRETTALLGMTLFLASWAMLFAALFFAYGLTRVRAPAWPPPDLPRAAAGAARAGHRRCWRWPASALQRARRQRGAARRAGGRRAGAGLAGRAPASWPCRPLVWRRCWRAGPAARRRALRLGVLRADRCSTPCTCWWAWARWRPDRCAGCARAGGVRCIPLRLWTLYLHMVGDPVGADVRRGVPAVTGMRR